MAGVPCSRAACADLAASRLATRPCCPWLPSPDAGCLLQRLQVGQGELGTDGLDVGGGVDLAVDVGDVVVAEHPRHLADRRGLADVGEELVAQPLPLGRAAHDAGDVDELDRRGMTRAESKSAASFGSRGSGTATTPTFGSMVANG
jgi:hypothetical protein